MKNIYHIILILFAGVFSASAQQESQYSQYMYNTMSFNPGYTGSREVLSVLGLYRTQWVGLEGAPKTMNFSAHSPIGERFGIGLNIANDQIGPTKNTGATLNLSYTILGSTDVKYSFGVSGGFDNFTVDNDKLTRRDMDDPLMSGVVTQFSPNVGVGFYVHSHNWYLGVSAPKLLKTEYYKEVKNTTYSTQTHFYLLGGYVFDLNPYLKFKPAFLVKSVQGAPLAVDVSGNFLINDKFTLGAAYRWGASASALAGFQITDGIQLGYGYDHDVSGLRAYNSGSHEFFLRFELVNKSKSRLVTPRFF